MVAKATELRDWARELEILGAFMTALNIGILFGHVTFPDTRQYSISSLRKPVYKLDLATHLIQRLHMRN